jgi:hypothetical protein
LKGKKEVQRGLLLRLEKWKSMNQSFLDLLATQLAAYLDCTQDVACQQILRGLAETGQPLTPTDVASRLQIGLKCLATHLAQVPDAEFDIPCMAKAAIC